MLFLKVKDGKLKFYKVLLTGQENNINNTYSCNNLIWTRLTDDKNFATDKCATCSKTTQQNVMCLLYIMWILNQSYFILTIITIESLAIIKFNEEWNWLISFFVVFIKKNFLSVSCVGNSGLALHTNFLLTLDWFNTKPYNLDEKYDKKSC